MKIMLFDNYQSFVPVWVFWVGAALALLGRFWDYFESNKFVAYGVAEKNIVNQDRFGYFDPVKFWYKFAFVFVPFVVAFILTGEGAFGFGLVLSFIVSAQQAIKNRGMNADSRLDQIDDLRALATLKEYDYQKASELIGAEEIVVKGGVGRFFDFSWFQVKGLTDKDPESMVKAHRIALPHIWQLSQKPETEWFKDTTFKVVG